MTKSILCLSLSIFLFSCTADEKKAEEKQFVAPEKSEVVKYYPNGKMRIKGMLYDGKRHGKWIYYYENGFLWSEGMFHYGKRDGYSLLFYDNGKKMVSGEYENDKPVEDWHFFNEDGSLDRTIDANEHPEEVEQQMKELAQVISG